MGGKKAVLSPDVQVDATSILPDSRPMLQTTTSHLHLKVCLARNTDRSCMYRRSQRRLQRTSFTTWCFSGRPWVLPLFRAQLLTSAVHLPPRQTLH